MGECELVDPSDEASPVGGLRCLWRGLVCVGTLCGAGGVYVTPCKRWVLWPVGGVGSDGGHHGFHGMVGYFLLRVAGSEFGAGLLQDDLVILAFS